MAPLLAVDDLNTAALLCDHLADRDLDAVHAVHVFAPDAGPTDRRDGEEALNVVRSRLGASASVTLHRPEGVVATAVVSLATETDVSEVLVGHDGETAQALRDRGLSVVAVEPQ